MKQRPNTVKRRLIGGGPVSCRTCKYVENPDFPPVYDYWGTGHFHVACARNTPVKDFNWFNMKVEPFCGDWVETEGDMECPARSAKNTT